MDSLKFSVKKIRKIFYRKILSLFDNTLSFSLYIQSKQCVPDVNVLHYPTESRDRIPVLRESEHKLGSYTWGVRLPSSVISQCRTPLL